MEFVECYVSCINAYVAVKPDYEILSGPLIQHGCHFRNARACCKLEAVLNAVSSVWDILHSCHFQFNQEVQASVHEWLRDQENKKRGNFFLVEMEHFDEGI